MHRARVRLLATTCSMLVGLLSLGSGAQAGVSGPEDTYLVVFNPAGPPARAAIIGEALAVQADLSRAGILIVRSQNPAALRRLPGVTGVARDRRIELEEVPLEPARLLGSPPDDGCAGPEASCPLQWELDRIHLPDAWKTTRGSRDIKLAVLDTGLNSSHEQVGSNYDLAESRSFVQPSDACPSDEETHASPEDFGGHGTMTASTAAGRNGPRMTGIAPHTTLINLRVFSACGFARVSWVLEAMAYAEDVGARVLSASFGIYLCADGVLPESFYCHDPERVADDPATWQAFVQMVEDLTDHASTLVASAGNSHLEFDALGRVVSAGSLGSGPKPANDRRGMARVPTTVPGVVTVAALNRVNGVGSEDETRFGQYGAGHRDQLAYYSNYGDRIVAAAHGGSRNFNLPPIDCLSDSCRRTAPSSPDGTDHPGLFLARGVDAEGPCNDCYGFGVGATSHAAPMVAGVAALALAVNPDLTPAALTRLLRRAVTRPHDANHTPPIASDPESPWFNYDMDYDAEGIPPGQMGGGVIDAALAVTLAAQWR